NDGKLGGISSTSGAPTWVAGDGAPLTPVVTTTSTVSTAIDSFTLTLNTDPLASAAANAANYSLGDAGADSTFGTGDDSIYAATPPSPGTGRTVTLTIPPTRLHRGRYRFRTLAGLADRAGPAVTPYSLDFVVANPAAGLIENTGNNPLPAAMALPMTETPAGS